MQKKLIEKESYGRFKSKNFNRMSEKPAADISENIFALMKMTPESSYSFRAATKLLKNRMPENAENMFKDDTVNELNQKIKTIIEKKLKEQDVPRG